MGNHYHLLVETPKANLSMGMRQLNGVYTQDFNRKHKRVGHLFQGRFKSILVQKESYLLELARYIVLNPVRAGMVHGAGEWRWSSYRATAGYELVLPWLCVDVLLSHFAKQIKLACEKYREFISDGAGQPSPWEALRNQVFLGDDEFVEDMRSLLDPEKPLAEVPSAQRRKKAEALSACENMCGNRNEAITRAWESGGDKMKEIADYFDVHYSTVSKILRTSRDSRFKT